MIQRARTATFSYFALNGFTLGIWVVYIPEIKERTDISQAMLGYLLLVLSAAAVVGMQVAGRAIDRLGSRTIMVGSAVAVSLTVIGPALATSALGLALALIVLGFFNGMIDVSQNAHAVEVERRYERPILSAFHALFSLGGLLASIVGGIAITLDADVRWTLGSAAAAGVVVAVVARRDLITATPRQPDAEAPAVPWDKRVLFLGLLAFTLMLSEGVAYDWSTVHLHDSLGASKAVAAYAFGAFSIAMTIMRLLADRIVARVGSGTYVRVAALVGATGMTGVALAPNAPFALASWAVFGLGLAGCVPQFFSAAGNVNPQAAGTYLARVAAFGYAGLLVGPAVIGILTRWVPLTTAFAVPLIGCIAAGMLAPSALRSPATEVKG